MIELSFSEFCLFLLFAAMVSVGLFSWISRFAHVNAERRGRRIRLKCPLCLTTWEDRGRDAVVSCPHCGRDCERTP